MSVSAWDVLSRIITEKSVYLFVFPYFVDRQCKGVSSSLKIRSYKDEANMFSLTQFCLG